MSTYISADFAGTSNLLNTSKPKRFRTGVNITVNEKLARNDQTTRSEPDNLPVDSELIQHANCGDENGLLWNEVGVGQNDLTMKPPGKQMQTDYFDPWKIGTRGAKF